MNFKKFLFLVLSLTNLTTTREYIYHPKTEPTFKLSFGSCFKYPGFHIDGDSIIFQAIKALKPDCFIWLGDFAYVDKRGLGGIGPHYIASIEHMKMKFYQSYYDESNGKKINFSFFFLDKNLSNQIKLMIFFFNFFF